MTLSGANSRHSSFTNTSDNGFFSCTADKTIDVRSNCHPCDGNDLNAIFRNCSNPRSVDDFRIHAHLYRLQDITASKVDRRGTLPWELNCRTVSRNQSIDNSSNISTCKKVGLHLADFEVDFCFRRTDQRSNNLTRGHLPESHADKR